MFIRENMLILIMNKFGLLSLNFICKISNVSMINMIMLILITTFFSNNCYYIDLYTFKGFVGGSNIVNLDSKHI